MNRNDSPLRLAAAFALLAFVLALFLFWLMPRLPELLWTALWEGSILLPALLLALLVGFLIWLNRTLADMRSSYGRMITELKLRIQVLEEKLDNTKKD